MMQVVATKREIQNLQHPIELHPVQKDYQGQDPRVVHLVVPDSIPVVQVKTKCHHHP
jgi:hypothetical protein